MRNKAIVTYAEECTLKDLLFIKIVVVIVAMLIISIGIACSIVIDQVCKQQIDTLGQLNYIRQVLELQDEKPDAISDAVPVDPVSVYALNPDERDLVCRVVAAEARGEGLQGMMAVAQTILDRSELWNQSVTEVVTTPDQYADPYQGEISDEVYLAVADVFDGGIRVFDQPVTHFYDNSIREPKWVDGKECRGSVDRMKFYY